MTPQFFVCVCVCVLFSFFLLLLVLSDDGHALCVLGKGELCVAGGHVGSSGCPRLPRLRPSTAPPLSGTIITLLLQASTRGTYRITAENRDLEWGSL